MKPNEAYKSVADFTEHLHAINVAIAAGVPALSVAFVESVQSPREGDGRSICIVLAGNITESQARLILAPANLLANQMAKDFHANHIAHGNDSDQ